MNEELKRKWIEALRSGKYEQGRGCLRLANKFCCFGVLCDISGVGEWRNDKYVADGKCYNSHPPRSVSVELGNEYRLILMNDNGATFPEIADWVEQRL